MTNEPQGNRTEVEPAVTEKPTPKFQHLAPALHAGDMALPGEDTIVASIPKKFSITLSDGSRQRVDFTPGIYEIPLKFKEHFYLAANGVTFPAERKKKEQKVETTDDAIDYSKITIDSLSEVEKMDQLKAIFTRVGGDVTTLKGNASKDDVREAILTQVEAKKAEAAK